MKHLVPSLAHQVLGTDAMATSTALGSKASGRRKDDERRWIMTLVPKNVLGSSDLKEKDMVDVGYVMTEVSHDPPTHCMK